MSEAKQEQVATVVERRTVYLCPLSGPAAMQKRCGGQRNLQKVSFGVFLKSLSFRWGAERNPNTSPLRKATVGVARPGLF